MTYALGDGRAHHRDHDRATAFARAGSAPGLKRLLPWVTPLSGALLVLAGLYLAHYGIYEPPERLPTPSTSASPSGQIAALTAASGIVVIVRMYETHPHHDRAPLPNDADIES